MFTGILLLQFIYLYYYSYIMSSYMKYETNMCHSQQN